MARNVFSSATTTEKKRQGKEYGLNKKKIEKSKKEMRANVSRGDLSLGLREEMA